MILEILKKLGFDWQVALANFVNFLLILFVLKRYAFAPVKKIISERQNKIREGLENAKKAEAELMMAGEKKEEIVKAAKTEAGALLAEAAEKKNEIVEKAKDKAEQEAAKILSEAGKNNEKEKQKMLKKIKEESIALVLDSAEKFLKEKMGGPENEKYVKELLS